MFPSKMNVNKKLLPIKGHFFLFNAGTAPLVPFLSTYARQLGFSPSTVGLMYTVLPLFGLVAKPLFGVVADRFKIQKSLFILFQVVTIISFSAIYFIPDAAAPLAVQLDCGDSATALRACFGAAGPPDRCRLAALAGLHGTAQCRMNCDMTSPKMWQTVCEHWHMPQYCYSSTARVQYSARVAGLTSDGSCVFIASSDVTLDGLSYKPRCRIGLGYVDINEPCSLDCGNQLLSSLIGSNKANMSCLDNMLSYRLCDYNVQALANITSDTDVGNCQASCDLDPRSPWRLMEICEGWGADAAATCQPKSGGGQHFPDSLAFDGTVLLSTTLSEHNCVYIQLNHIQLDDGSIHYPYCGSRAAYQVRDELFHSTCNISCDHEMVNELFKSASDSQTDGQTQYTTQFWLFFTFMIVSWIGQAVVVTFADAICFNLLGTKISLYGKQRLWGSVGWGIFSLVTGILIDAFSEGAVKNYAVAFILMLVFMSGDVLVSCFLKVETTKMSINILADVGSLLTSLPTLVFVLWTIGVGLCTGLIWQFLFWHIEDIAGLSCDGAAHVKTLQGLASAIQTFGGEIPFLFVSGYLLRKFGHINTMSLVLFAFGVRFMLYSVVTNPWWILPIEMFQGITFGMFYPTMTSYATVVSPPGTETTVQGLVGAVFEGVGTALGSLAGGRLYAALGGWKTFRYFGAGALLACAAHALAQCVLRRRDTALAGPGTPKRPAH
ncbi:major facilitator superfamily domain-containing protein 6 [Pararge aegeria]|nr:major facilitator superfamily domain-containing protein 6 [Pararge aegeria]XP_039763629.1 major facilitator superfamily domain-containing protein 6 [Pararge aegeria]XP_039763630.1 major facilitator superfamily domain-containing protein 6 [Pararge aegeria]